jgi:predicted TPR repeat methyltransferase
LPTTRQHLESALTLHRDGKLAEAAEHYRAALQAEVDNTDALHLLGVLEYQRKNLPTAIELMTRAVVLDPDEAIYHGNLGNALKANGQTNDARTAYQRAIHLQPDFLDAHVNLGNLCRNSGDTAGAIKHYRDAAALDPDNPVPHGNLGRVLLGEGQFPEAATALEKALGCGDGGVETRFLLGNALQALEQNAKAVQAYTAALEIAPGNAGIHSNLGKVLKDEGELDAAQEHYRQAIELDPELLSAHYNSGIVLMEMKRGDEAIRAFETAVRLDPSFAPALRGLARIADARDDLEAALAYLQRWQKASPDDPEVRHLLSYYGDTPPPARAPDDYVRSHFDQFARDYDQKLDRLDNHGPSLLATQLGQTLSPANGSLEILDAGCGTGLCGPVLRPWAARLTGVDLSAGMLQKARQREIYDELLEQELTAFLNTRHSAYDVIASSDTFNYFGQLRMVFDAARRALRPHGHLFFNVEVDDRDDELPYRLQRHGRYCHSEAVIRSGLKESGFTLKSLERHTLRLESSRPVACFTIVAVAG